MGGKSRKTGGISQKLIQQIKNKADKGSCKNESSDTKKPAHKGFFDDNGEKKD